MSQWDGMGDGGMGTDDVSRAEEDAGGSFVQLNGDITTFTTPRSTSQARSGGVEDFA